jgi:hypothetical protein
MEAVLLVLAIATAASICPAMMWWQRRRGRAAACARIGSAGGPEESELDELRRRRDEIEARIAELGRPAGGEVRPATRPARHSRR